MEKKIEELSAAMFKPEKDKATDSYKEFMVAQLAESQNEAKRHFENYV